MDTYLILKLFRAAIYYKNHFYMNIITELNHLIIFIPSTGSGAEVAIDRSLYAYLTYEAVGVSLVPKAFISDSRTNETLGNSL